MSTSSTGDALLAAVHADRSDLTVRLVYADWLQENDVTELAEYIRLECEWLTRPFGDAAFPKLAREAAKLCTKEPLGGWEYAEDLARIRGKMDRLRDADREFRVYGAYEHQYKTLPPIPEVDLLQFEARLGFPLPADYRAFLLRVCNGPMGEYEGLEPFELNRDLQELQRPFALTREQIANHEYELVHLQPTDVGRKDGWLYLFSEYAGFGCLVIHGEARGLVIGNDGWDFFVPAAPTGVTFLQWYERWLDQSLKECARKQ